MHRKDTVEGHGFPFNVCVLDGIARCMAPSGLREGLLFLSCEACCASGRNAGGCCEYGVEATPRLLPVAGTFRPKAFFFTI